MRSVAITCVKNEIDIVEAFVRHTLALVDHLVILDNGSHDGTLDVLRALANEGLPLEIVEDHSPGQYQPQRMTRLMHEYAVARHAADWVFPLDGDEFLAVRDRLALIPEGVAADRPLLVTWRTYVPDNGDNPCELNPVLRIRRRRVARGREFSKVIVPGALAAVPQATLAQGSHDLLIDGVRCEPVDHPSCHLGHFPLRSLGQYAAKVAVTSLQYQAMARRNAEAGIHYHYPFELLKRDWPAFAANLPEVARKVALPVGLWLEPGTMLDPLPYHGGPLRYTPRLDEMTRAWQALLGYAEDLARQHAVLAAGLSSEQQAAAQRLAALIADLYAQLEQRRKEREDLRAINYAISLERLDERAAFAKELENVRAINYAIALERQDERADFAKQLAEIHQSWTWRIGRLLLGPMAWAETSGRRCYRALARAILPARPVVLPVGNLEIHVAHACNLRCESCSHYTNQGHQGIVPVEEAERWAPYLQYQPLGPDCTPDELTAFFAKEDEPFCGMCPSQPVPFELPWPLPASVAQTARRLAA
jgi:glycosyltransferase involved in cell wall biosynthesis